MHPDHVAATPEAAYIAAVPHAHRKQWGQFFTPAPIAAFMAEWVLGGAARRTILDPAVGLGIFFRAIRARSPHAHTLIGYDLDPLVLDHTARLFSCSPEIELRQRDFLLDRWDERFDGIMCNPPYLQFQQYKQRAASLHELEARLGVRLNGLANSYALFLLKALHQLAPGGRAAFIVPLEFLNADYGRQIKGWLLAQNALRYVISFDANGRVFDGAITTACILLCANDPHTDAITFTHARSSADLPRLAHALAAYPHASVSGTTLRAADLDPGVKWRAYYQPRARQPRNLVPLGTYGSVVRGIATGDNAFFTFDRHTQQRMGIADRFVLPCVTKAAQAPAAFFVQRDWAALHELGKRVLLLNALDPDEPALKAYLAQGMARGAHTRYLTSHRNPWHAIEQRPPAPILVTVFHRGGVRWVRNEANVRNLTCFHNLYLAPATVPHTDLLMAYLITDVARDIVDHDRRDYGGGLKKFEPNDLNRALVIDLAAIDAPAAATIRTLYARYRAAVIDRRPAEPARAALNTIFVQLLQA